MIEKSYRPPTAEADCRFPKPDDSQSRGRVQAGAEMSTFNRMQLIARSSLTRVKAWIAGCESSDGFLNGC